VVTIPKSGSRRGEVGHYALQVVGTDGDVGVVDEQIRVARVTGKLDEVADLSIGSKTSWTFDEADRVMGKLELEMLHRLDGRVIGRGYSEEQLVFSGIVLAAVAAKGVDHLGIAALERLEDADRWGKVGQFAAADGEEDAGGHHGLEKVDDAGNGENRGEDFHGER
jgi:hypothetical protein